MEELKQLQLDLLDTVAEFCKNNEICYWLDFGTLLGAVRHGGYIPWDDDIDIGMPRSDFEKFIRSFNVPGARYQVHCFENNKTFYYPYAKVLDSKTVLFEPDENGIKLSVNIDVFPYDNAPDSKQARKLWHARATIFYYCNILRNMNSKPCGGAARRLLIRMMRLSLKPFPKEFFCAKQVKNAEMYRDHETGEVCEISYPCPTAIILPLPDPFTECEFEGKRYQIPESYDEWLTAVYGDYMRLPPPEQRQSHHKFVAYAEE